MPDSIFKMPMFGKEIEIIIKDIDKWLVESIVDNAYKEGARLSKIFNFYDSASELSELNKKRRLIVSNDLLNLIVKALEFCELTKGMYDITQGVRFMRRKKGVSDINLNCSYKDIDIIDNEVILKNPDILIDLGSIAKGYIVDKIVEYLIKEGVKGGLVDGRGDIRVFGENEEIIGIQHPREKNKLINHISLLNSSVATSGDYNQFDNSFDKSHIINQKEVISVSVIAKNLMIADIYATALFVLDEQERKNILKKNKEIKALIINKNQKLNFYNGFEKCIVNK